MELKPTLVIDKPWGEEQILTQTDKYIVKILCVAKGHRLSKQYHKVKDETLWLLEGNAYVEFNGDRNGHMIVRLEKMSSLRIFPNTIHRIGAREDTKILEVSSCEADDVVRLEDDYNRV